VQSTRATKMSPEPLIIEGVEPEKYPQHIVVILDGNGRWAEQRRLPRIMGHRAGVETVRKLVEDCSQLRINALTIFAFSSENWRRPDKEVGFLMDLFLTALNKEVKKLHENNIKIRFIGDTSAFNSKLQKRMTDSELLTESNSGLSLNIAVNYGGQWDITQAMKKIAAQIENNELASGDITAETISDNVCLNDLPAPDLFIRTGGEQRISNFLNWQLAYTELYFTDLLWPDFNRDELFKAIKIFANRQRRFGQTSAQVEGNAETVGVEQ